MTGMWSTSVNRQCSCSWDGFATHCPISGGIARQWKAHKNKGLLHEARKLHATALVYVSGIATSAPSTAYAVPLPRIARGRLGLWHISFPRQSGGSGERSEPIGAFMNSPLFVFLVRAAQTAPEVAREILLQCGDILFA